MNLQACVNALQKRRESVEGFGGGGRLEKKFFKSGGVDDDLPILKRMPRGVSISFYPVWVLFVIDRV